MAWLSGWLYRKSITLSRASGAVTNYPLKILVGESSGATGESVDCGGKCQADFDDIRFTNSDETTLLDYWIESITGATPNQLATIWVEFDSIGTGATTFYMYYGKADAAAVSNGPNTFYVFDHFDNEVVGAIWTPNGSPTETGTTLTLNAVSEGIQTTSSYADRRMRARINFPSNANAAYRNWAGLQATFDQANIDKAVITPVGGASTVMYCVTYNADYEQTNVGAGYTDAYVVYQIDRLSTSVKFYFNDALVATHAVQVPDAALPAWFMAAIADNYFTGFTVDWVFISQIVASEPTFGSWSSEENYSVAPETLFYGPSIKTLLCM